MATVVLIGTLDTKGAEYGFVKEVLLNAGVEVLLVDTGIMQDPWLTPDIPAAQVAEAGGRELTEIRFGREGSDTRALAVQTMSDGLKVVLPRLLEENRCDAVFGMGGSGGTNLLSQAMLTLPLGLPKMILSTMMSGDVSTYVGFSDMTMMYSITDIAGLNRFSRLVLTNAANAVAGMARGWAGDRPAAHGEARPLVAISMFGITTPGVNHLRKGLEEKGFDTIVFHATGSGGKAMEALIANGQVDGVIDFTLAELCSRELGGIFPAGDDRLTNASKRGIPQIVVPGAIEVLNFRTPETIPEAYRTPERCMVIHNPTVCAVRALPQELTCLGWLVADKLNAHCRGNTKVLLPLKGLDNYQSEGSPWQDGRGNPELFEAIESGLKPHIPVERVDANINDAAFAQQVLSSFFKLWQDNEKSNQRL